MEIWKGWAVLFLLAISQAGASLLIPPIPHATHPLGRVCDVAHLWLLIVTPVTVLVTARPVEIRKRGGVLPPPKYGVSNLPGGLNIRGKRSRLSVIADFKTQLRRTTRKCCDGAPDPPLRRRPTSGPLNITDDGYDSTYFTTVQMGTVRSSQRSHQCFCTACSCIAPKRKPLTSMLCCKHEWRVLRLLRWGHTLNGLLNRR